MSDKYLREYEASLEAAATEQQEIANEWSTVDADGLEFPDNTMSQQTVKKNPYFRDLAKSAIKASKELDAALSELNEAFPRDGHRWMISAAGTVECFLIDEDEQ